MSEEWRSTLLHVASSTVMIVVVFGVSRARRLPLRSFLGLRWPGARQAAYWMALFVLLVIAEEVAADALGLGKPEPWGGQYTGWLLALRIVGIVVLAPAAEELVFRGVLFSRIAGTRLGPAGAIVIPAVLFALVHVQYPPAEMMLVAVDGLFYGLVRWRTGSVFVPMLLHSLGNGYAVYQRLFG
jgi:membrane protease YdiL (CAAX protease family)